MRLKRLSREDAGILRKCAIKYFKQRYPKYSGLDLSLRGETLVISCGQSEPIPPLIEEISQILRKASIAIGINCANLEINGQKIISRTGDENMLLEEEVVSINDYRELIDMAVSKEKEKDFCQPEAIPLITLSELSAKFSCPQEDLVKALDHKNQRFFAANKDKISAIAQLSDNKIKAEAIEKALQPIELFVILGTQSHGIRVDDIDSAKILLNIQGIPTMLLNLVESLREWNPDCINEEVTADVNAATDPTADGVPKRRGRPKSAGNVKDSEDVPKAYRLPPDKKEGILKSIANGRVATAAKAIISALDLRGQEFLASASAFDDRYIAFIDRLVTEAVKRIDFGDKTPKEKKDLEAEKKKILGNRLTNEILEKASEANAS
jgi:hypothetical protein